MAFLNSYFEVDEETRKKEEQEAFLQGKEIVDKESIEQIKQLNRKEIIGAKFITNPNLNQSYNFFFVTATNKT